MTVTCIKCRSPQIVDCTQEQLRAWELGELIQRAMPNVVAAQRELLVSGYCGQCWDALFGGDDGDEEDSW